MTKKVAIVTGGARRIGKFISEYLLKENYSLVLHYNKSEKEADKLASEYSSGKIFPVRANLESVKECKMLIEKSFAHFGEFDLLVNNAAIFERKDFLKITEEEFDRMHRTNLKAPFFLSQFCIEKMLKNKPDKSGVKGRIVNMIDASVNLAWKNYAHYQITKSALQHLTKILARTFAPEILVNAIAPYDVLPDETTSKKHYKERTEMIPLRHEGSPQDTIYALEFLLKTNYATGTTITIDGGRNLV